MQHWLVNNLFGIAFSISGVEMFHLNNVVTGCILLCGLFVYDIFWVFGTNVMVTVAKSFEAPIKRELKFYLFWKSLEFAIYPLLIGADFSGNARDLVLPTALQIPTSVGGYLKKCSRNTWFWSFTSGCNVSYLLLFTVVFPQDLLEHGLSGKNFAMLGLGDIVIPGIFIALLLRFDNRWFFNNSNSTNSIILVTSESVYLREY